MHSFFLPFFLSLFLSFFVPFFLFVTHIFCLPFFQSPTQYALITYSTGVKYVALAGYLAAAGVCGM